MNSKLVAGLLIFSAFCSSLMGINVRSLTDNGFDSDLVTFFRLGLTTLILFVILLVIDRSAFKIKKKDLWLFIVLGVAKGLMDLTFTASQNVNPLSLSAVLQMTAPFFVMLFSYFIFKEKITPPVLIAVVVCIAGAVLVTGAGTNGIEIHAWGMGIGLLSGVTLAIFLICTKMLLERGVKMTSILFYEFFIGLVFIIPITNFDNCGELLMNDSMNIPNIIGLSIVCTLIPYYIDTLGSKYLKALTVSVLMTFEIVFSAWVGHTFYDETVTALNALGIAMVIASIIVVAKAKERKSDADMAEPPKPEA